MKTTLTTNLIIALAVAATSITAASASDRMMPSVAIKADRLAIAQTGVSDVTAGRATRTFITVEERDPARNSSMLIRRARTMPISG